MSRQYIQENLYNKYVKEVPFDIKANNYETYLLLNSIKYEVKKETKITGEAAKVNDTKGETANTGGANTGGANIIVFYM